MRAMAPLGLRPWSRVCPGGQHADFGRKESPKTYFLAASSCADTLRNHLASRVQHRIPISHLNGLEPT